MKFLLADVSKKQIRKPGFVCASVIIGKEMILLFHADKGVVLENHAHPHAQMGYCIQGTFDFIVEGRHKHVLQGESYLLDRNIRHGAIAITDYYSLDLKTMLKRETLPERECYGLFKTIQDMEAYQLSVARIGGFVVRKILYKQKERTIIIEIDTLMYLITSNECTLNVPEYNRIIHVEPMKIYRIDTDQHRVSLRTDIPGIELLLVSCSI